MRNVSVLPTAPKQLLTVSQVAKWFNVSQGWVRDHASGRRQPKLPSKPFGKLRRFDEDELSLWLQALSRGRAA